MYLFRSIESAFVETDKTIDIQLLDIQLSQEAIRIFIQANQAGAEVYFIGTVRNETNGKEVVALDFEAYKPMAIKEMEKIAITAHQNWPILKVAMHHRVGKLKIGEIPVIIGVSAAHRKAAFEAGQYCIDTLKETVPIWKKEIFENGEEWVSAHP